MVHHSPGARVSSGACVGSVKVHHSRVLGSAAIFAIDTGDKASQANGPVKIAKIDERMAGLLGTTANDLTIADMAVNPTSGNIYFSVGRGRGPQATPVILRLDRKGDMTEFSLKDVKYSKAELPNPPQGQRRAQVITGLGFSLTDATNNVLSSAFSCCTPRKIKCLPSGRNCGQRKEEYGVPF